MHVLEGNPLARLTTSLSPLLRLRPLFTSPSHSLHTLRPPCRLDTLRNAKGNLGTAEIRRNMQKIMQSDAAVFRTQSSLEEGCSKIDECVESFK